MEITKRTVFYLSWTTSPNNIGYGDPDDNWTNRKYHIDLKGTIRTLRDKWEEEKRKCGLNGGVYYAYYIIDKEGKEYNFEDLEILHYELYGCPVWAM